MSCNSCLSALIYFVLVIEFLVMFMLANELCCHLCKAYLFSTFLLLIPPLFCMLFLLLDNTECHGLGLFLLFANLFLSSCYSNFCSSMSVAISSLLPIIYLYLPWFCAAFHTIIFWNLWVVYCTPCNLNHLEIFLFLDHITNNLITFSGCLFSCVACTGHLLGVHRFSKHLDAISELQEPEMWQDVCSVLRTHKY
jgi:hypothetical protein